MYVCSALYLHLCNPLCDKNFLRFKILKIQFCLFVFVIFNFRYFTLPHLRNEIAKICKKKSGIAILFVHQHLVSSICCSSFTTDCVSFALEQYVGHLVVAANSIRFRAPLFLFDNRSELAFFVSFSIIQTLQNAIM